MAKSVLINGVTYPDVPAVSIPLASDPSQEAIFRDTSGGTATAGDLREGATAYGPDGPIEGTIPVQGAGDVTATGDTVNIPAGIYDTPVSKQVDAGSVTPTATVSGSVLGDTATSYPVTATPGATVDPGYVDRAEAGTPATKYVQVEERTATPTTAQQEITPAAGKLISKVTVQGVVLTGNATPADVIAGKTFYTTGLTKQTGTATVPAISQNSQTKVLTIS